MKKTVFLISFLFGILTLCSAQQNPNWDNWIWLVGEWIGEGSGQPGTGGGKFSFEFDLDKNVLIRKSHSEYPASDNKSKVIHDDLMIIYLDSNYIPNKAVYFDNESHTIFYTALFVDKKVILTSPKSDNAPIFRLIYTLIDNETINTDFQISQDGLKFNTYIEGNSKKLIPSH